MKKIIFAAVVVALFANVSFSASFDKPHSRKNAKLIECSLTKKDLHNTCTYQALSSMQDAISVCQLCSLIQDISDGEEDGWSTASSFALSAMVFIPATFLIEKLIGTLTLKLAEGRIITNKEILGLILFFEERLRVPALLFVTDAVCDLIQIPTAMAASINADFSMTASNATSSSMYDPREFQICSSTCAPDFVTSSHYPSYEIAANLMFINPTIRLPEHGLYFLGKGTPEEQLADFNATIVQPIVEMAHDVDVGLVVFWLDHKMMADEVFLRSRETMCRLLNDMHVDVSKILLRTIRDIPEVASAPDIFTENKLVYWRCDIARMLAALFTIEQMGAKISLYKDLDMRLKAIRALLSSGVLSNLYKHGIVFAGNGKGYVINGLFIVSRDSGLREHIVERSVDWIRQGYVTNADEDFVYAMTYVWWASQFGLTKADMVLEALKNNWQKNFSLIAKLNVDKYGKFFDVVDVVEKSKSFFDDNMDFRAMFAVGTSLIGCSEGLAACKMIEQLDDHELETIISCEVAQDFCDNVKKHWLLFLPRLENLENLYLSAQRRTY